MLKYLLLSSLLLFLLSCSENKMLTKLDQSSTILAFGDSLTFGYGAPTHKSYPSILSELTGLEVINAGMNGEVSRDGLKRLEPLLDKHKPQLLLLCHGANDMLQKRSLELMANNIEKMITLAQEREIEVLLIAVPNTNILLTPLKQYQDISNKMQVPLENDLISDVLSKPSLHSDIIHPNSLGYQKMAEKIYDRLATLGAL